jgi:four helix bundle protein
MKYKRFEDLPVWQAAAQLSADIIDWTDDRSFRGVGDLANQLQRASMSISNNIAEGFERGTTNELINFLYYARGSAGGVRSMLAVMQLSKRFGHLKPTIEDFTGLAESISRQIRGWTNSLQNSEIEGQKCLNDETRRHYEFQQRRQQALAEHRQWRLTSDSNF